MATVGSTMLQISVVQLDSTQNTSQKHANTGSNLAGASELVILYGNTSC